MSAVFEPSLATYVDMSVLIVDDNVSNVALFEALLRQEGLVSVTTTTDPRTVMDNLADWDPDLVLLDLHMPHIDGFEVLGQVQQFAAGSYLPVLVMTADSTLTARDRALGAGAQDYLTKPIDTIEATLRIANLLHTRRLYSALRSRVGAPRTVQPAGTPLQAREDVRQRITRVLADEDPLTMVFQPVVDLATMATVGHEALARFPDHGLAGPDRWFREASEVGLGAELEWHAVHTALRSAAAGPEDTFTAVNMSPTGVMHVFESDLCQVAACDRVVIELTEHVPVEDYSAIHRAMREVRGKGVRLAADDLGSGYAGFRHLVNLEPDIIKLDISLTRGIHRSAAQRALARALLAFAADMGATVIAEGVEEPDELAVLTDLGVPLAQGYLLGRPGPLPAS